MHYSLTDSNRIHRDRNSRTWNTGSEPQPRGVDHIDRKTRRHAGLVLYTLEHYCWSNVGLRFQKIQLAQRKDGPYHTELVLHSVHEGKLDVLPSARCSYPTF
jgi:hypothetical protein